MGLAGVKATWPGSAWSGRVSSAAARKLSSPCPLGDGGRVPTGFERAAAAVAVAFQCDLAQAGAFAAVAGLWAGLDFDLPMALRDGRLVLPGLGAGPVPGRGNARLRRSGARLEWVTGESVAPLPEPRPLRVVTQHGGLSLSIDIDHVTPNLDRFRHHRLASVDGSELRLWSERLSGAWRLLAVHHQDTAESISVSVRTIVPLLPDRAGSNVAATSPSVFGAIATSLPSDDLTLAETLVHEFQHLKLCAILDLLPLVESGKGRLSYAPWRDDPRPARGCCMGRTPISASPDSGAPSGGT